MKSNRESRIFCGADSSADYLNLEDCLPTPLIEIPSDFLGGLAPKRVRAFAKLECNGPLSNVKRRQVLALLADALRSGALTGVHTIVEGSSGSTAHILPPLARLYGIENVKIIPSPGLTEAKLDMIRLVGGELLPESENGIETARELGKKVGWLNLDQYGNEANPEGMKNSLGPEIWEQIGEELCVFAAGMGTAATITGVARFLKEKKSRAKSVGVYVALDQKVPGVRTRKKLQPNFGWQKTVDFLVEMERDPSFLASIKLIRRKIFAGPSSGFALMGLIRFLNSLTQNELDGLRNRNGEVVAVFVCADSQHLYTKEYAPYLQNLAV